MNLKVLCIIILLSLLFVFGFKKIYASKNGVKTTNIEQLKILKFLPEENKLLFISNFNTSNFFENIKNDKNSINQDNFVLIESSILNYLGIDLGNNKFEDIYNNELLISTFENKEKHKDDILIVFKIKPDKKLDDILHLSNTIDQSNEIISINRENKLNYLTDIYRTDDNYIIASSNKKLILNCINNSDDLKDKEFQFKKEIGELKNEKNILLTNTFGHSKIFDNELPTRSNKDIICTTFTLKNKYLVLKSYLLNNQKNLYISSYDKLLSKETTNQDNQQVLIFSDLKTFAHYLKPLINDFENSFLNEFNQIVNQNILILNSSKDWIMTFEKNTKEELDLSTINKLKDYNQYTLRQNENIYSIYSKDILEEKNDAIKHLDYEDIYSVESPDLFILSNNLIDGKKLDYISSKFLDQKINKDQSAILYTKVDIKNNHFNKFEYLSYLKDINFLLRNIIKISNEEVLEIAHQTIPEKNPILYTENSFKIIK